MSDSLRPHDLCSPWNSPGQNTGVGRAFPFSRGSSQPRDRTQVSHIAGGFFTSWATREAPWSFRQAANYPILRLGNLELFPFPAEILPLWKRILLFLQGFHYRLKTQNMEIPLVFELLKMISLSFKDGVHWVRIKQYSVWFNLFSLATWKTLNTFSVQQRTIKKLLEGLLHYTWMTRMFVCLVLLFVQLLDVSSI